MEPFQPVLEILKQLEEEDTELAFQAARLVWYYRCLWESCVSKHTDGKQLEEANEKLRAGNIQLCNEGSHLKLRQDEQVARLHSIKNALDEVRGNLLGVLKVWNDRSAGDLAILPGDGFPRHLSLLLNLNTSKPFRSCITTMLQFRCATIASL